MEFQLLKFSYPKYFIALLLLISLLLAFYIGFALANVSSSISKNILLGVFIVGFGFLIFAPKKFTSCITVSIGEPFSIVIDDNSGRTELNSIEKWKYFVPSKLNVAKIKFINAGKSYRVNIYNNEAYYDFLKTLKRVIKEYNEVQNMSIVNLDTEFYNSKSSSYIFKGLFLLNFVFLVLLYFDAPSIRFGLALGASILLTLLYGLQQYFGKNKE